MMGHIKLGTALLASLALAACASTTDVDDSMRVGVNDNDGFSASADGTDTRLSDAQTFGINDDDNFEATSGGTMVAAPRTDVASAVIRKDQGIYTGTYDFNDYTTVRNAISTAGLSETLDGGEFTVFAPSNASFSGMDLSGASQADLQGVLKGHVVAGRISSTDLQMKLDQGGGTYTAQTLSGENLTFMRMGNQIKVADKNGYTYNIEAADNEFKNGYVHGINGVLGRTY